MIELSTEFWIGTALAVPLSVLASLIAPTIQRALDSRRERASAKRIEQLREDLKRIERYRKDAQELYVALLEAGLEVARYGAAFGAVAGVLFLGDVYAGGQAVSLLGTIIVLRVATRALDDLSRYRAFDDFEAHVRSMEAKGEPHADA